MITIEEFEIAAKDLSKAFVNIDAIIFCMDEENDDEYMHMKNIANESIRVIRQYWIETASKRQDDIHKHQQGVAWAQD